MSRLICVYHRSRSGLIKPEIVVVDKRQRKGVVVDVAIPSDGNIKKKEHEKQ